jgi:hypothetical protein
MLTVEKKSLKVGKYVDSRHVDTVIRNYKQERWVQNSERIGKEDSLSLWYSIEELEEFIEKIKEHGADGIKMYFAAYPKVYPEKPEYAARQTMVLVATKNVGIEDDRTINKDIYISTEKGSSILAYNMSQSCPPYCNGRTRTPDDDNEWGGIGVTIVDRGEKGLTVI